MNGITPRPNSSKWWIAETGSTARASHGLKLPRKRSGSTSTPAATAPRMNATVGMEVRSDAAIPAAASAAPSSA